MSKALYRKYRSKSLAEIVGQAHVTEVLAASLKQGFIAHAYLLTGPRGIGKTSIARILAHEINQLPYTDESTHLDIIEIDAASNNGVEDIRELRDKVQIAPVKASKKVYIIDEVHMLSKAAFNALLKTLEEPPAHIVFILATTDVDKLPATIISRTQRFSLRAITKQDATAHLAHIAKQEDIAIEHDALELIAERGEGSFRDSISLLDQIRTLSASDKTISRALIEEILGLAPVQLVEKLLEAYLTKDLTAIVTLLEKSEATGVQASVLTAQLIRSAQQRLIDTPQFIHLIDELLLVSKSSQPNIKLLTILGMHAAAKPKSAALVAPAPVVSAPIAELEKQATKPKPQAIKHSLPAKDEPAAVATITPSESENVAARSASIALDWEKLIQYTREHFVATYSVLARCGYTFDGKTIVIYTVNAFYKKKLDDNKYRGNLSEALAAIGIEDVIIETIGTPPPPKDSTAAAVAVIMGGGEEVNVAAEA